MQPIRVREATADDVPAITAIYNEIVANSTAIYSFNPSTLDERRDWFRARTGGGWPVRAALRGDEQQTLNARIRVPMFRTATRLGIVNLRDSIRVMAISALARVPSGSPPAVR